MDMKLFVAVTLAFGLLYLFAKALISRRDWLAIPTTQRVLSVLIVFVLAALILTVGFKMDWLGFRFQPR